MLEASIGPDITTINGLAIKAAIQPARLWDVLGEPSRIVDPAPPAPFGHRNNQIHVYDQLGLYFNEHHFTRLVQSLTFVFVPAEHRYTFCPSQSFAGRLLLGGYEVRPGASESDVIRGTAIPFRRSLAGQWRTGGDGFGVGLSAVGAKIPSGRRSKNRRVVSVDVAWPHDPWQRA